MSVQHWSEKIWIAKLANEPSLSEDLTGLCDEFKRCDFIPNLLLDLTGVTRINSTNISQMLHLRRIAVDADAKLYLAGPGDELWAVFLTTGLDKVFNFAQDVPSALAELQILE